MPSAWRPFNEMCMQRSTLAAVIITLIALVSRLAIAIWLPNDEPDDGKLYALIARNVVDHGSYSGSQAPPYQPTYIRVPGYPLFLAGIYEIFGSGNNTAVRIVQAIIDTGTCWLVALLAAAWSPAAWSRQRRRRILLMALALATLSPFVAIYSATILTETLTTFFAVAATLGCTIALKSTTSRRRTAAWVMTGIAGGLGTMTRPDAGLWMAACGLTLVVVRLAPMFTRGGILRDVGGAVGRIFAEGAILSFAFVLTLLPWTIRNAEVLHTFQPLAPESASMPNEFFSIGYPRWLSTWVDDFRYVMTVHWPLDAAPFRIEQYPASAFDSPEEREEVIELLRRYNGPTDDSLAAMRLRDSVADANDTTESSDSTADDENEDDDDDPNAIDDTPGAFHGRMTPSIDSAFGILAQQRIARHPLRQYVGLPARRAIALWFDTHSSYYPFAGELFPFDKLKPAQKTWLSIFALLVWVYTLLALWGAWMLWRIRESRWWLLLLILATIPRLAFFATLPNPEPRYVIELFAFVAAAGAFGLMALSDRLRNTRR